MLNPTTNINKVKNFLQQENLDYFLITSTDEFLNEYIELEKNSRYLVTGFSGSTGDALISQNKVFLFVDGRYHIQAEEETNPELITLIKLDLKTTQFNSILEILKNNTAKSLRIGINSSKTSLYFYNKLVNEMQNSDKKLEIVEYLQEPISCESITGKEKLHYVYPDISGILTEEKIIDISTEMKKQKIDIFFISKLEEISYLTNLRSFKTPYNSTFKAVAFIYDYQLYVFTDLSAINENIRSKFSPDIIFEHFNEIENYLEKFKSEINKIGYDETSINLTNYRKLQKTEKQLEKINPNPLTKMKSIKNSFELNHFNETFLKTDIVVTRAIQTLNQTLESKNQITEKEFSELVKNLFQQEGALSLSFKPIVACAENSAIIHYSNPNPAKNINLGDLILLDCGGYFEGGYATDITRTFIAGGEKANPDEKTKRIYTRVLKGFLHGINFPINEASTGYDIDKKVRAIVTENIEEEFSFPHGTGHGVGISVHESPPYISSSEHAKAPLAEGMCFTIEPGLYCEGWGGVRIENTVSIIRDENELKIKSLSRCSFDENLIDYALLSEQEKQWLNNYKQEMIGK